MSITMHGTSIFLNPVYISLYFPPSSNRDISMLFLALSYSYSEQCWSYINNVCPFWYDVVSLQLLPFVITPPLPKTGKHNWFLARSDDGKRLTIIRTHEPEKLYCKNPHCIQAPCNTWVSGQWLLRLWAGYQLVGAFRIFELEEGKQPWFTLSVSRTQLSD